MWDVSATKDPNMIKRKLITLKLNIIKIYKRGEVYPEIRLKMHSFLTIYYEHVPQNQEHC